VFRDRFEQILGEGTRWNPCGAATNRGVRFEVFDAACCFKPPFEEAPQRFAAARAPTAMTERPETP
jgi:hypothetical protein